MGRITGASDTQKMILLALGENWTLRQVDGWGWCLFQVNRARPFCKVKQRAVEKMTKSGWLTEGLTTQGLDFRPKKDLTPTGHKYAMKLIRTQWAETFDWAPKPRSAAATKATGSFIPRKAA